ncbi:MAG: truncated hemoglobin YjbI [Polyangiales bacterium]|jgi:truncated hemoglobin YjbI
MIEKNDFERLGGEEPLHALINDFVDGCFDDMMIGFLFPRNKRARVKKFEYQHAAEHLGAPVVYEGRSLQKAHGAHRIMGGQFDRRLTILKNTLGAHGVPDDIAGRWTAYHESMRALITGDAKGECTP